MITINPYERDVFYYETDKMGIVHHSNYIRWLEEARIAFLESIGLPFDELEARGILVPVLHVEFDYRLPFKFGDRFRIEMKISKFNGIKMNFEYQVLDAETGALRGTGKSEHCFTDENMTILRLGTERKELFTEICEAIEWKKE